MLVYDITCRRSFERVVRYRNQLLATKGVYCTSAATPHIPMVLVGNLADCSHPRQVSEGEGKDLASSFYCPYVETSSAEGLQVEEAFARIVRAVQNTGDIVSL